ncbi:bifunctional enzyme CysN/CysC [Burkholderiales bacterium]|nr:bifunctional enzyme CysN/CysC [Burkholderiales bacterium]
MSRDSLTALPTLCLAGPVGHGKTTLVDRLHDEAGDPRAAMPEAKTSRLRTPRREWRLVDAPDERELLRDLVTGGIEGAAALVVVGVAGAAAARIGGMLAFLHMLGVRDAVVAVNRMDEVDWREDRYTEAGNALVAAIAPLALRSCTIVPVSARTGANVRSRAESAWWTGPTLAEALDALPVPVARVGGPLRVPVRDVLASGDALIAVGRVASGTVAAGHDVLILPSNRVARVVALVDRPAAHASATIGEDAHVALSADAVVERGDVLCSTDAPPKITSVFDADVRWLGDAAIAAGDALALLIGTREVGARVASIHHVLEASGARRPAAAVAAGDVARLTIRCALPVAVDDARMLQATGRFLLQDDGAIAGAGVIDASGYPDQRRTRPASGDIVPMRHQVGTPERESRAGHRGAVIWLTGLSGAGKSTLALALERRLFDLGWGVYTLDGDNVRTGLNADLGFSPSDRQENLRRVGEVAALFADSGIVCVTAFISPYRDERARARAAAGSRQFIEVWVRSPLEECERRDPKGLYAKARSGALKDFTGIDSPYEPPESADLVIDTEHLDIEASTRMLVDFVVASCRNPA